MIAPARAAAFAILTRVQQGSWASELLRTATATLDTRDAGLASELVLGSLRRQAQLDFLVQYYSGRKPQSLDTAVLIALRLGLYQLAFLDRIPRHAAVGESVELVKQARKRSAAGFVNAVLRKAQQPLPPWPDRPTELSLPPWLLARWDAQFGPEIAARIGTTFLEPPEVWVRNPPLSERHNFAPSPEVPGAFRLVAASARGLRQQDIGSQSIAPLLQLQPGHTFLDLCAAPGNKTAQALEHNPRLAVACDLHLHRLRQVASGLRVVLDATEPLPFARTFDRILLDAPCSGTGTLARNPEIRWQLEPHDLPDLARRQAALLSRALEVLAPGGRLVYSTCSLEPDENERVVEQILALQQRRLQVLSQGRRTPGLQAGDGFFAAVLTWM